MPSSDLVFDLDIGSTSGCAVGVSARLMATTAADDFGSHLFLYTPLDQRFKFDMVKKKKLRSLCCGPAKSKNKPTNLIWISKSETKSKELSSVSKFWSTSSYQEKG